MAALKAATAALMVLTAGAAALVLAVEALAALKAATGALMVLVAEAAALVLAAKNEAALKADNTNDDGNVPLLAAHGASLVAGAGLIN